MTDDTLTPERVRAALERMNERKRMAGEWAFPEGERAFFETYTALAEAWLASARAAPHVDKARAWDAMAASTERAAAAARKAGQEEMREACAKHMDATDDYMRRRNRKSAANNARIAGAEIRALVLP